MQKTNYMSSFMSFLQKDTQPADTKGTKNGAHTTPADSSTEELMEEPSKETGASSGEETTTLPESVDNSEESKDSLNIENGSKLIKSRNVATRGKKRKIVLAPRVTPRRSATRSIKTYIDEENVDSDRAGGPDDPDYKFSDSDDDPDFAPSKKAKRGSSSPEPEFRGKRGRWRGRGRFGGRGGTPKIMIHKPTLITKTTESPDTLPEDDPVDDEANSSKKKVGRPSTCFNQDSTISSTEDTPTSAAKLSSAYNYAALRSRQNQAVRLPEGPNLTDEQLKLIESQFKSGDFVMAKKDTDMMEHPPIWRIDGKSLLQKFQAFEKDGRTLYRNISTYSGWTSQAKALYVPVKVNFVFQSRYDIVVELVGFKGGDKSETTSDDVIDKPVWMPKNKDFEIPEMLRVHMPSFEIYIQTLISQALDNNFLQEIYDENDTYFVERVKVIDDLCDERKARISELAKWKDNFQATLNTWPCVNTMVSKMSGQCQACNETPAAMLSQFYGQPYDKTTLRSKEAPTTEVDNKNFETCNCCSTLSQLYNKVDHQKYDFYSQCKSTVTNMRVSHPNKTTTNVLRDLLANDEWITGLFRSMCTTYVKIDKLQEEEQIGDPEEVKPEEKEIEKEKPESES